MSRQLERIRWTAESAAAEFGVDAKTIRRRIKTNGIEPSFEDGTFSTMDIVRSIFGDLAGEKLRIARADADLKEAQLAILRKEHIPADAVKQAWAFHTLQTRNIVMHSEAAEPLKRELLRQFETTPLLEKFDTVEATVEQPSGN